MVGHRHDEGDARWLRVGLCGGNTLLTDQEVGRALRGTSGQNMALAVSPSVIFIKACHVMGFLLAFTSYNNPSGNADTERSMRTLKEGFFLLINEWHSPFSFFKSLNRWIEKCNTIYVHSPLGYKTLVVVERIYQRAANSLKMAC